MELIRVKCEALGKAVEILLVVKVLSVKKLFRRSKMLEAFRNIMAVIDRYITLFRTTIISNPDSYKRNL